MDLVREASVAPVERRDPSESLPPGASRASRIARLLDATSSIGEALAREEDGERLLGTACRLLVGEAGFGRAWIGSADDVSGAEPPGSLAQIAFRTGAPALGTRWELEPVFTPSRHPALRRGYHASAALPILVAGKVRAALVVSASPGAGIGPDEARFLDRLARSLGIAIEKSEHRSGETEALRRSEEGWRLLLETAPVAMALHSGDRLVLVNRAALDLLGAADAAQLLGRDVLEVVHPDEREMVRDRIRRMKQGDWVPDLEERFVKLDGSVIDVLVSARAVTWLGEPAIHVAAVDVTGKRRADELHRLSATHDPLTGLANRAFFEAEAARLASGRRFPVSVVFAEVEGLRGLAGARGHVATDTLVREAAEALLPAFRADDTVARLGAGEFCVLMPDAGPAEAAAAVARLKESLAGVSRRRGGGRLPLSLALSTFSASKGCELTAAIRRRSRPPMV